LHLLALYPSTMYIMLVLSIVVHYVCREKLILSGSGDTKLRIILIIICQTRLTLMKNLPLRGTWLQLLVMKGTFRCYRGAVSLIFEDLGMLLGETLTDQA